MSVLEEGILVPIAGSKTESEADEIRFRLPNLGQDPWQ